MEAPRSRRQRYQHLEDTVRPLRESVARHWVYPVVQDQQALRTFMESHVFGVWDFMTLLKTLQRQLTCIDTPWVPPADRHSARLINEIVLGEESDEVRPGMFMSHLELYMSAMQEVGADLGPIESFLEAVRQKHDPIETLVPLPIPQSTKDFVCTTLELAGGEPHEVASAFLFGREAIIVDMFSEILDSPLFDSDRQRPLLERIPWRSGALARHRKRRRDNPLRTTPIRLFRLYLERHIEVDGDSHGPMAAQLLMHLCGSDPARWSEAENAATRALRARHNLWSGVAEIIIRDGRDSGYRNKVNEAK